MHSPTHHDDEFRHGGGGSHIHEGHGDDQDFAHHPHHAHHYDDGHGIRRRPGLSDLVRKFFPGPDPHESGGVDTIAPYGAGHSNDPDYSRELWVDDDAASLYAFFKERIYDPRSVLNACPGYDKTPSLVFDSVTFVDADPEAMAAMKEQSLDARVSLLADYVPSQEHDLLILRSAGIKDADNTTRHLKRGAYVLADGPQAYDIRNDTGFELVGRIDRAAEGWSLSRDPGDAFTPFKSIAALESENPYAVTSLRRERPWSCIFASLAGIVAPKLEERFMAKHTMRYPYMATKDRAEAYVFVKK